MNVCCKIVFLFGNNFVYTGSISMLKYDTFRIGTLDRTDWNGAIC